MKQRTLTYEIGLYLLAFLLAVLIRFIALGHTPLSDSEASLALQGFSVAQGTSDPLGPHSAYVILTGLWMFLFNTTDWMARFWPALVGSLFVLIAFLFREKLGHKAALILAFWAAIDPGLISVSHEAGSTMIAIFSVYAALGFALARRPVWTGIFAGLALLGGPGIWPGLVAIGLGVWMFGGGKRDFFFGGEGQKILEWRLVLIAGAAVWVLVSSLIFFVPRGLGSAGSSLPAYIKGWGEPSGISFALMLPGLLTYELAMIVMALLGLGRAFVRRDVFDQRLAAWGGFALLLAIIYPARQVSDLAWIIPPLLALASKQLARQFDIASEDRLAMIGQALLTAVMIFFAWAAGLNMAGANLDSQAAFLQWGRVAAALVLLGITTFLVAWGWSLSAARNGLQWGLAVVMGLYMVSSAFNSSGLSSRQEAELWRSSPPFAQRDLMLTTIRNFNEWQTSLATQLDIVVAGNESPALRWALRDFNPVSYVTDLPVNSGPAIVITNADSQMTQSAAYRGQDFLSWQKPAWDLMLGREWVTWSIYRKAPYDSESIILWVRTDLFPGGVEESLQSQPDNSDIESQ